jgi:putative hydrolase of HD superfamily
VQSATSLKLISYVEGLKRELRNSWLSDGRQESVAEHSWRMVMMAMILAPQTKLKLDMEKVLKMAAIHDLAEIEVGDIPTIHQTNDVVRQKALDEQAAIETIRARFSQVSEEVATLWREFEDQKTAEARFVRAIDKLECAIQKNQQTVDTKHGKPGYFEALEELCKDDSFLHDFYKQVAIDVAKRNYSD